MKSALSSLPLFSVGDYVQFNGTRFGRIDHVCLFDCMDIYRHIFVLLTELERCAPAPTTSCSTYRSCRRRINLSSLVSPRLTRSDFIWCLWRMLVLSGWIGTCITSDGSTTINLLLIACIGRHW